MREDEEELITADNNVTADAFIFVSSSHRDKLNAILTSENLEKLDKLVDAINSLEIKYTRDELNTATTSDAQCVLMSNQNTVTHTSNIIFEQKSLSLWIIEEVFFLPFLTNLRISVIVLAPQTLLTPLVKEIFEDATLVNVWTTRTLRKTIRTGVDSSIPIFTPIHS